MNKSLHNILSFNFNAVIVVKYVHRPLTIQTSINVEGNPPQKIFKDFVNPPKRQLKILLIL